MSKRSSRCESDASLTRVRRLLRRIGQMSWQILKAVLLAGAAMGPSVPPPTPPPPQTIMVSNKQESAEDDE